MAKRLLKDTTKSGKIDALSAQAEVLFYRLIMKADDYGVFHANVKLVLAELYPLKLEEISTAQVTDWLNELFTAGLISFYQADGKPYLFIFDFGQRMRNMKNRFPPPPANLLPRVAASCENVRPEIEIELEIENEIELEPETKKQVDRFIGLKDLKFFEQQGFSWNTEDDVFRAGLEKYLRYRFEKRRPVENYMELENIIREFALRNLKGEEAVKYIDHTIARGWVHVVFDLGKQEGKPPEKKENLTDPEKYKKVKSAI